MIALLWVVLAWSVTLGLFHRGVMAELFRRGGPRVERAQLALVLVLLGSFSGAAAGSAEEVLANPLASERVIRGLLVGLALLILLPVVVDRLRDAGDLRRPALASLSIYVFVCGVSTLYSSAPLVTAAKAAELAVALTVVWALVTSPDAQRESRASIELLIRLLAALVILAMAGFFVFEGAFSEIGNRPGFVFRQTMTSPYLHSNGLSAAAALAATYAMGRYLSSSQPGQTRPTDRRWRWLILSILSVGGVVLSSGRQGLAMVLLAMAVLLWMWRRSYFLLLFLPGLATVVWAFWESVSAAVLRGQPIGLFTALSGRLTWWSSAITAWAEHPWTGFGFGVGGRFVALERIGFGEVSSVHNGYLEALVGVGLIGVVPLIIATLFAVAYSVRQLRRDPAEGGLIVPLLLHTMVSLGFGGWLGPQWLLFALLVGRADLARLKNAGLPGPQAPRMDQLQVSSFRNVGP